MFTYGKDLVTKNEFLINFETLGKIKISTFGESIPYYGFQFKGEIDLLRNSEEQCKGDCFQFLMSNFKMFWNTVEAPTTDKKTWIFHEEKPRVCTAEDVGKEQYDKGLLLICPPFDGLLYS